MNPIELILNQMLKSPQVQQNPMTANVIELYKRGDTEGLKKMAENVCSAKGYTVEQVQEKLKKDIQNRYPQR